MHSEERLKSVVASILGLEASDIGDATSTDNVPQWDSVRHMNLVIALEESFAITIPDDEVATMTSFPIIKAIVDEQLGTN